MEPASSRAGAVDHRTYPADYLREILRESRSIAMVGASLDQWRPSYGIMRYLQRSGYRVFPVNPNSVGESVHGEPFFARIQDIPEPVDLVNVFRRVDAMEGVVEDAISAKAPRLWMQLGIRNDAAAAKGEAAGMQIVMDRCISVEHGRLMR